MPRRLTPVRVTTAAAPALPPRRTRASRPSRSGGEQRRLAARQRAACAAARRRDHRLVRRGGVGARQSQRTERDAFRTKSSLDDVSDDLMRGDPVVGADALVREEELRGVLQEE